jgi:hypothetical protein
MRRKSGNLRANPTIFKMIGENAPLEAIVLEDEGDLGKYNRANRSLNHFVENGLSLPISLLLNSITFPFPTFVTICFFAVGRVLHQSGYVNGYGKHGAGFLFASVATETLNGLLLLIVLKGFSLFDKS